MAALLLEPATAQEAAAMLAQAGKAGTRIVPRGASTKLHWHDDERDQTEMSTLGLSAPVAHYAGDLVAVYDGMHGWFWRNRTGKPVSVTLKTGGDYLVLKEMK